MPREQAREETWTGRVLADRFAVMSPLGAGGMAEVYRARDRRLGRDVIVEMMAKAPEMRPRSATEVTDRLTAMMQARNEQRIRSKTVKMDSQKTGAYGRRPRRSATLSVPQKVDAQTRSLVQAAAQARREMETGRKRDPKR